MGVRDGARRKARQERWARGRAGEGPMGKIWRYGGWKSECKRRKSRGDENGSSRSDSSAKRRACVSRLREWAWARTQTGSARGPGSGVGGQGRRRNGKRRSGGTVGVVLRRWHGGREGEGKNGEVGTRGRGDEGARRKRQLMQMGWVDGATGSSASTMLALFRRGPDWGISLHTCSHTTQTHAPHLSTTPMGKQRSRPRGPCSPAYER